MARLPRTALVGVLVLSLVVACLPARAQSAEAPPFVEGANTLYCHATTDGLNGWINALVEDGDEAPYYLTGAGTVIPGAGVGVDPVAQESVDAHLPLTPALAQTIVVGGTVTAQAFIGSGAYGGGMGSFGSSLMAGTTVLGSAAEVEHQMVPHNSNDQGAAGGTGPYEEITWTFEVPETPIPAGTVLEWVISGTVEVGNNVFLACNEQRGRSNIDVPVLAVEAGGAPGNESDPSSTNATSGVATTSPTTTASNVSAAASSATNTTTNATADGSNGSKDSPSVPLVAALAVAVAAVMARRRLVR